MIARTTGCIPVLLGPACSLHWSFSQPQQQVPFSPTPRHALFTDPSPSHSNRSPSPLLYDMLSSLILLPATATGPLLPYSTTCSLHWSFSQPQQQVPFSPTLQHALFTDPSPSHSNRSPSPLLYDMLSSLILLPATATGPLLPYSTACSLHWSFSPPQQQVPFSPTLRHALFTDPSPSHSNRFPSPLLYDMLSSLILLPATATGPLLPYSTTCSLHWSVSQSQQQVPLSPTLRHALFTDPSPSHSNRSPSSLLYDMLSSLILFPATATGSLLPYSTTCSLHWSFSQPQQQVLFSPTLRHALFTDPSPSHSNRFPSPLLYDMLSSLILLPATATGPLLSYSTTCSIHWSFSQPQQQVPFSPTLRHALFTDPSPSHSNRSPSPLLYDMLSSFTDPSPSHSNRFPSPLLYDMLSSLILLPATATGALLPYSTTCSLHWSFSQPQQQVPFSPTLRHALFTDPSPSHSNRSPSPLLYDMLSSLILLPATATGPLFPYSTTCSLHWSFSQPQQQVPFSPTLRHALFTDPSPSHSNRSPSPLIYDILSSLILLPATATGSLLPYSTTCSLHWSFSQPQQQVPFSPTLQHALFTDPSPSHSNRSPSPLLYDMLSSLILLPATATGPLLPYSTACSLHWSFSPPQQQVPFSPTLRHALFTDPSPSHSNRFPSPLLYDMLSSLILLPATATGPLLPYSTTCSLHWSVSQSQQQVPLSPTLRHALFTDPSPSHSNRSPSSLLYDMLSSLILFPATATGSLLPYSTTCSLHWSFSQPQQQVLFSPTLRHALFTDPSPSHSNRFPSPLLYDMLSSLILLPATATGPLLSYSTTCSIHWSFSQPQQQVPFSPTLRHALFTDPSPSHSNRSPSPLLYDMLSSFTDPSPSHSNRFPSPLLYDMLSSLILLPATATGALLPYSTTCSLHWSFSQPQQQVPFSPTLRHALFTDPSPSHSNRSPSPLLYDMLSSLILLPATATGPLFPYSTTCSLHWSFSQPQQQVPFSPTLRHALFTDPSPSHSNRSPSPLIYDILSSLILLPATATGSLLPYSTTCSLHWSFSQPQQQVPFSPTLRHALFTDPSPSHSNRSPSPLLYDMLSSLILLPATATGPLLPFSTTCSLH